MAQLETWYKQDLKKPLVVHRHADVFNQDSRGNLIGVEIYSDGEPVTLSGSIDGYCLLADGRTISAVGASRSGNKASILIPQTAYGVPGPITVTIKNTDGDDITTLCAVVGLVRQSVSGNLVQPGDIVTDWSQSINAQLQAVQDAADNVGAIVAAPFAENTAYVVGNYVTYNGNLYRITADHAAGVTWANTAKTQCTVGTELCDLKSAISEQLIEITGSRIKLYQGAISVSGTSAGEPVQNANRVYTSPIKYNDYVEVNTGYQIAYAVTYIDGIFSTYASFTGRTSIKISTNTQGSSVRLVIAKSDNTQPVTPSDNIIKTLDLETSDIGVPTIKALDGVVQSIKNSVEINNFSVNARIANSVYKRDDNSTSIVVSVKPDQVVTFKAGTNTSYFVMLKSYSDLTNVVDYATGYSSFGVQVTDSTKAVVPSDANYLFVLTNVGGTSDRTPKAIIIDGYDIYQTVVEQIGNLNNEIKEDNGLDTLIQRTSGYADKALKWLAVGDSYTEINDTDNQTIRSFIEKGYMDRVCEKIPQLECTNQGHSGLTFVNWGNRLNEITSGYDLYTIMLGTNDWSQDANWGTISDFTNRTAGKSLGVLGKLIDRVHSVAPNAKLVVMTQLHRTVGIVPGATTIAARNHDTYLPNASGLYFADMEKDIIDCCKLEGIEYVDIFTESHVTPRNAMKFAKVKVNGTMTYLRYPDYLQYIVYDQTVTNPYDSTTYWVEYDGVHPSKIGMEIIAELLADKLRSYLFE